jgi:hypothetical protein
MAKASKIAHIIEEAGKANTPDPFHRRKPITTTNSHASFLPLDDGSNPNNGMTKAEFAAIHFVAAHLTAHGRMPDKQQLQILGELAVDLLDKTMAVVCEPRNGDDEPADETNFEQ